MEIFADANEDTLNTVEQRQCVGEDTVTAFEKDADINEGAQGILEKEIDESNITILEKPADINEGTGVTLEKHSCINEDTVTKLERDTCINEGTIATLEKATNIKEGTAAKTTTGDIRATGNFYDRLLKPHEKVRITNLLNKYVKPNGECIDWTKQTDRHGYGIIRFVIDKTRIKCTVHRLSYFLHHEKNLQLTRHVSHLCFNRVCVKVDHLSYEPQSINNARKRCKFEGYCAGHYGYSKCLVELIG